MEIELKPTNFVPLIGFLPLMVAAAPVELTCLMTNGSKEVEWQVSLDETAGTVSYTIPEMKVDTKYRAIFTANKVTFASMEISRVDLSMKRTTNLLGNIEVETGQCQIAAPTKRKF